MLTPIDYSICSIAASITESPTNEEATKADRYVAWTLINIGNSSESCLLK
jgi:hypothetical protein